MNSAMIEDQIRRLLGRPQPWPIVQAGDPVLRQRAADLEDDVDRGLIKELIAGMREAMLAAPGVGLAAPQIGVGLRLAVLEDAADVSPEVAEASDRRPLPYTVIINPQYRQIGHDIASWYEGCLSVAGLQAVVDRAVTVELRCLDEDFAPVVERYSGWQARIVQHETDHTDGVLYLDKAITRSISDQQTYLDRWAGPDLQPARQELGF